MENRTFRAENALLKPLPSYQTAFRRDRSAVSATYGPALTAYEDTLGRALVRNGQLAEALRYLDRPLAVYGQVSRKVSCFELFENLIPFESARRGETLDQGPRRL